MNRTLSVPLTILATGTLVACVAPTSIVPVSEERIAVVGKDIVFIGADNTGVIFIGRDSLNVTFLDADLDGAADFLRYSGPRDSHSCNNVLEDYEMDGQFDMRWYRCEDATRSFQELRFGENWYRVDGADQDRHVVTDGRRRPVVQDGGRMRVADDREP